MSSSNFGDSSYNSLLPSSAGVGEQQLQVSTGVDGLSKGLRKSEESYDSSYDSHITLTETHQCFSCEKSINGMSLKCVTCSEEYHALCIQRNHKWRELKWELSCPQCPAGDKECRFCHRKGHFEQCFWEKSHQLEPEVVKTVIFRADGATSENQGMIDLICDGIVESGGTTASI